MEIGNSGAYNRVYINTQMSQVVIYLNIPQPSVYVRIHEGKIM